MRPLDWYLCAAIVVLIGLWWLSMNSVTRLRREVRAQRVALEGDIMHVTQRLTRDIVTSTQSEPKMPLRTEPPAAVGKIREGAPRAQHLSTRATGPDYDPGDSSVAAPQRLPNAGIREDGTRVDDGLCILCFHAPHGPIARGTRLDVCEKSCADYGCPAWRAGADLRRPTWGIS